MYLYISTPYRDNTSTEYSQCTYYNFMYFSFTASEIRQWNRTLMLEKFDPGVKYCDKGWDYNRTEIFESAVSRVSCFEVNYRFNNWIEYLKNQ